jgi:hypothetical protein
MFSRAAFVVAAAALLSAAPVQGQTWTRIAHNPPGPVNFMVLLSDGTVMASRAVIVPPVSNDWYRLTPDDHGSYVNGTWSVLAPSHEARGFFASQLLPDGRFFVMGGEYGTGTSTSEMYNPVTNTWTNIPLPPSLLTPPERFADACSEILDDGRVLIAPTVPHVTRQTLIFNPATDTWSAGPLLVRGSGQPETTWVKLPDNSILTVDPFSTYSERYIPALNQWINDSYVTTTLCDGFVYEMGPAMLLPNGKAIYFGSTGATALYTPSGTTAYGVWETGPTFPDGRGAVDAPCSMLVTGDVLCAVGQAATNLNPYVPPTTFYEYKTATNTFVPVPGPGGAPIPAACVRTMMLNLPDGSVLFSSMTNEMWAYRPSGAPLDIKPVIQTISHNADGSFHLTGTGFNGWCEGASYGDDAQMNGNYPIVRLSDAQGHIYYGRTFNWSSTGVRTGSRVVSTDFRIPDSVPPGQYLVAVVANAIASEPVGPVSPVVINGQPEERAVCRTGSATFTVDASNPAEEAMSYQWQCRVAPGSPWTGLSEGSNPGGVHGTIHASGTHTSSLVLDHGAQMWTPWAASGSALAVRCVVDSLSGVAISKTASLFVSPADLGTTGGVAGADGAFNNNDFVVFISDFFALDPRADIGSQGGVIGSDGSFTNDDFVVFIGQFFAGC